MLFNELALIFARILFILSSNRYLSSFLNFILKSIKMGDSEATRIALQAERDLNSYQAKQGIGAKSDSSM